MRLGITASDGLSMTDWQLCSSEELAKVASFIRQRDSVESVSRSEGSAA